MKLQERQGFLRHKREPVGNLYVPWLYPGGNFQFRCPWCKIQWEDVRAGAQEDATQERVREKVKQWQKCEADIGHPN